MKRVLVALIAGLCLVAAEEPSQIHLAYLPNGATVSWFTESAPSATPAVRYGLLASNLNNTAYGSSSSYDVGHSHHVVLPNLLPYTFYYYLIVGSSGPVRSFRSPLPAGDKTPFDVFVTGDMGLDNSADTHARMLKANTSFFFMVGDISYADNWYLSGRTYEGAYNQFMNWLQPITAENAFMTLPGNHEATCSQVTPFLCPGNQRNFSAYRSRFRMPSLESGGVENLWWSMDYGQVHFIAISTETDFPNAPENPGTWISSGPFGDQLGWLERDLQKAVANRHNVPWIVVGGHRPWYTSGKTTAAAGAAFEPLFIKYGVDIFFAGHVHWYERLWPLGPGGKVTQKHYTNPDVPVYIISGAAGSIEGHADGKPKEFTAHLDTKNWGYGRLHVYNATTARWAFHHAKDDAIADEIIIYKDRKF